MGITFNPNNLQITLTSPGVKNRPVTNITSNPNEFIQSTIDTYSESKQPFYILNLGSLISLYEKWSRHIPTIQPYYAVKCNTESALIGTLAGLGSNFDCASKREIEIVLSLGVSPDRIIFANPCKFESHIKYAEKVGVNMTTFDSICELEKIKKWHPTCQLLIRIKPPLKSKARRDLSSKFGALSEEIVPLLKACKTLSLNVVGVAFHIGSCASDLRAYREAIATSKAIFDTASFLGLPKMTVLDIGGGFTADSLFEPAAEVINTAVVDYFGDEPGLKVIAEPGRFFAETCSTLVTNVIGKRVRGDVREYWINDGTYGSFNGKHRENISPNLTALAFRLDELTCKGEKKEEEFESTVFGPTCDSMDFVLKGYKLPEMEVGDWLVFPEMGAYTAVGGSDFNGFDMESISTHLVY